MARLEIDFLTEYDDAAFLAELKRIAQAAGSDTVTKAHIKQHGRVSYSAIVRRFGSLRQALHLAGLRSSRFMKSTHDELIATLIDLWQQVLEKEGRSPQQEDLKKYGFPVSNDTVNRRFGSWRKALLKAHAAVTEESLVETPTRSTEESPRKREALSLRKRFFVLKRDHFACVRCGASGFGVRLEVHHRHPFAKGGSDNLVNLETLCYECNRGQRDSVV